MKRTKDAKNDAKEESVRTDLHQPIDKYKFKNKALRVPLNDRRENIKVVATVLNDDELMKGTNNTVPPLIEAIRTIVNSIEPSNENSLYDTLTLIQEKIHNSPEDDLTDTVRDTVNAFIDISYLSFKQVRLKLEENSSLKKIMDPVTVGRNLN